MRSTRGFAIRLLLAVAFSLCSAGPSLCQQSARPERGTMPNRSYSLTDIENISLENGNVNLTIPLASLPPIAGGKLSWTINANYNSKLWNVLRTQGDYPNDIQWNPYVVDSPSVDGGWAIGGQYVMDFRSSNEDFSRLSYPGNSGLPPWELNLLNNYSYWKVVLRTPDGAEHEFRPLDYSSYQGTQDFLRGYFNVIPSGTGIRYYSADGTYMFARISGQWDWALYMSDATRIIQTPDGVQRIQDPNGNKIKIFSDATGTHFQDEQTNREIRTTYDPGGNGGQGQSRIWYATVAGIEHHIDINYGITTVQGKTYRVDDWLPEGGEQSGGTVCERTVILNTQLTVVREIIFPQTEPGQTQRRFTFSYNSDTTESASNPVNLSCNSGVTTYSRSASRGWGELSRIVTPSGSIVDYSYALDSAHALLGPVDDLSMQSIAQKKLTHDSTFDTWTYAISEFGASVSSPDGNNVTEVKYCATSGCATGKAGLAYRTTRPFMMTERHWTNLTFSGASTASPGGNINFNPAVDVEYTTLLDGSNNPLKMSAKALQYDYNGNLTQATEYDWFDPALVSRDTQGVPTGVPAGVAVLRVTSNSYYNQASSASSANVYARRSLSSGAPLILAAAKETILGPGKVQFSYDGLAWGVAPTVGNLTARTVWADLDNKWITTSNTYDVYGNVATSTDARGKVTQFLYDDATHALPNRVVVDPQNGTGTQTATTAYDFSTGLVISQIDVNGQVTTIAYTNQLLGAADPFGRPGVVRSPTVNISGSNHQRRVTTKYLDATRQVIVESDLNAENDKLLKMRTTTDMLGRPILSESTEDGANYTISVRNAYLNMGQVTLTSGPMRSTATSTDSWTRFTKDTAGRVNEVATFGGATQPGWTGTAGAFTGAITTAYTANFTTVTDQAGKVRRSMVDALGRLLRVDEPDANGNLGSTTSPAQPTNYEYDVLGNLKKVIQGAQERTFTYDSLSRLRTAINPESGMVSYQYDDNGNLLVKTDPRTDPNDQTRKVSTHFEYDALNRLTRRWYNGSSSISAATPNSPALPSGVGATDEVKFYYDTQALPAGAPPYSRGSAVGRLVAQTYGSGSNGDYYAYDVLGRQPLKIQQTGTINYEVRAAYNLVGAITALTYPSNHSANSSYDQAGHLTTLSGNLGDGTTRTYANNIAYSPFGGLTREQFGTNTPLYHKLFYNSRGQLFDTRLSSVNDTWDWNRGRFILYYSSNHQWGQSGTDNNGNVHFAETWIPPVNATLDQADAVTEDSYSYDSLNRLTSVAEQRMSVAGGWGNWQQQFKQQYGYDRYGNRTIDVAQTWGTGINNKQFAVNATTNRLAVPVGQTGVMSYDSAGNLTRDTYTGFGSRVYDAENKMTAAQDSSGAWSYYSYDADGQRLRRKINNQETWQIYGINGELLAEYAANAAVSSPQKEYGYRNGELLVTAVGRQNVALSANGGVASASSSSADGGQYNFTPAGANNGNRSGAGWGSGEGWNDNAPTNTFPDWLQIDFNGSKTIDEIDVFTVQDNWQNPSEPTETMTFSSYGLTGFDVQYWNGSSWVTVPGGSVTGNNKVWRKFTFAPLTTSKIRVLTNASGDGYSRLTEVEAWGYQASGSATIQWLVTDHLGTPRMIVDQTGVWSNVKRHDYLPFGEELFAAVGGRSATQGYVSGDGVRQQFTAKERDNETELDYFGARYYSSTQGRFSSADPLLESGEPSQPQSWN